MVHLAARAIATAEKEGVDVELIDLRTILPLDREAILRLNQPAPATVRMSLVGQSSAARIEAVDPLPGKTHYLKGSGSDRWHADLPAYARVRYTGVYP